MLQAITAEAFWRPALPLPEPPTETSRRSLTVLLVDDNHQHRIPLVRALRDQQHNVLYAASGDRGAELFRTSLREIDALVACSEMKRLDGFDLARRVRLASPEIGLDTHIQQIVNLIEYEDLKDVVLVGYSYSGMVVTGVVDRIPQRIRRVIYVDAFLPENGESTMSFVPGMHSAFAQQIVIAIKMSELLGLVPAFWESPSAAPPRQDPQPLKTLTDPIVLRNPAAQAVPGAYLQFVPEGLQPEQADFGSSAARARARHWPVVVMTGEHSKPGINPEPVARQIQAFIEER